MDKTREDNRKWWEKRIDLLTEIAINDNVIIKANDIYNKLKLNKTSIPLYKKGVWTLRKLVIYNYYIDIYTKIIKKRPYYNPYYYFDLFSGSGLVNINIGNKEIVVFGSPLLAALTIKQEYRFHKYILLEKDKARYGILKKIFNILKQEYKINLEYQIINEDMNNIDCYLRYMNECKHALVIIDPEGLEPKWSTISKLLSNNCDVIITFMESGIKRVLGKAKKSEADKKILEEFIGRELMKIPTIDKLEKMYIENIQACNKKAYRTIEVKTNHFEYDIIIATKKTKKDNPWLKPIEDIRKKLKIDDKSLESIALQKFGKQYILNDYF